MDNLFVILFFISTVCLIIGIIKPKFVVFWTKNKTKKQAIIVYCIGMLIFFILIGLTTNAGSTPEVTVDTTMVTTEQSSSVPKETSSVNSSVESPASSVSIKEMTYFDKISIGMTKQEVDAVIGLAPKAIADDEFTIPNSFSYFDNKEKYGVEVVYSEDMKLTDKTVKFDADQSILSVYCTKPITKEQVLSIAKNTPLAKVIEVFGSEGVETTTSTTQNIREWVNTDGSNITAYYSSDTDIYNMVLINKDQTTDSDVSAIYEQK